MINLRAVAKPLTKIKVEGEEFAVFTRHIANLDPSRIYDNDSQALVGCLTGQLEWSTEEPTKDEEEANED